MTETDGAVANLIERYLTIVADDDYERFGELLTDDCSFTLMPIGHTWSGRGNVMRAVVAAGRSRTHDSRSKVTSPTGSQTMSISSSNTNTLRSSAAFASRSTDTAGYFTSGMGALIRC